MADEDVMEVPRFVLEAMLESITLMIGNVEKIQDKANQWASLGVRSDPESLWVSKCGDEILAILNSPEVAEGVAKLDEVFLRLAHGE